MICVKTLSFLTRMTLNRSARDMAKCEQRWLFNSCPAFFISELKRFVTYITQVDFSSSGWKEGGLETHKGHTPSTPCTNFSFGFKVTDGGTFPLLDTLHYLPFQDILATTLSQHVEVEYTFVMTYMTAAHLSIVIQIATIVTSFFLRTYDELGGKYI